MKCRICLLIVIMATGAVNKSAAQKKQNTYNRFSEWNIRLNPFSFIERFGGVQLGFETNLDKKRKLNVVSEYGYLFLDNKNIGSNNTYSEKNINRLSGFKTKQDLRWRYKENMSSILSIGIEFNYQKAAIVNSGWFGMGTPDAQNLYPYFKYQDFREEVVEMSSAIKYIVKTIPKKGRIGLEGFGGLGLIDKRLNHKNSQGKLVQPDAEPLLKEEMEGLKGYIALGFRIFLTVKQ